MEKPGKVGGWKIVRHGIYRMSEKCPEMVHVRKCESVNF